MSFLAECLLDFSPHPFSIVRVNTSPHIFSIWMALLRIKPPDAVTLVRPIQITPPCPIQNPSAGVDQTLCLCKPGFAAAQRLTGLLALRDIDACANDLK